MFVYFAPPLFLEVFLTPVADGAEIKKIVAILRSSANKVPVQQIVGS
jgi:hypothetical protein